MSSDFAFVRMYSLQYDCTIFFFQARSEKALLAERLREEAQRAAKDAQEAELRARAVKESGQTAILLQAARR
jgi:hypothetical protein